jgi:hypothetical protein
LIDNLFARSESHSEDPMPLLPGRPLLGASALFLAIGVCFARDDGAEAVKEKLFQAKKEYDAAEQKFKKSVSDWLDKREEKVRKDSDIKMLEQVKVERSAFDARQELPSMLPQAVRDPIIAARIKLDKAYVTAEKEFVKLKMDDAYEATEKERQQFYLNSAMAYGKKAYVSSLKHFDVKGCWRDSFDNTGTFYDGVKSKDKIEVNGEPVPHSLFVHPTSKSFSQVRYPLGGKWTFFHASAGVPKIKDGQADPSSELRFEVIGDDKSLWKSEPVTKKDEFQICTVKVEKVKTLTLRVHCAAGDTNARAFWIEPVLVE